MHDDVSEAGDGGTDPTALPPGWPPHWPAPDGTAEVVAPRPALGLGELTTTAAGLLALASPVTPCLVGPRGSGRSTALGALAALVDEDDAVDVLAGRPVVRVRAEAVLGRARGNTLRHIRGFASLRGILALDDLEVLLGLASPAVDLDLRGVQRDPPRPGGPQLRPRALQGGVGLLPRQPLRAGRAPLRHAGAVVG